MPPPSSERSLGSVAPARVEFAIRRATAADAGEILTLQRAAWLTEARLHETFDLPPLTQSLDELGEELTESTSLVATLAAGRIVGTVRARLVGPDTWYVARLGVVPDLQNRGIARALLAEILRLAPLEATRCALITGPNSEANIAFYERRGFRQVPPEAAIGPSYLVHMTTPIPRESP